MANTFGAASKWSDVLNDAGCVALGSKGSPRRKREIDESRIHEADPLAQHPRAGRFPDQLHAQTKRFRDCENHCCPGSCARREQHILARSMRQSFRPGMDCTPANSGSRTETWPEFVRTHFEVTINSKSDFGGRCEVCRVHCEDAKQKLNEAMAELQEAHDAAEENADGPRSAIKTTKSVIATAPKVTVRLIPALGAYAYLGLGASVHLAPSTRPLCHKVQAKRIRRHLWLRHSRSYSHCMPVSQFH